MNLLTFLLFDAALLVIAIPLIFVLQARKKEKDFLANLEEKSLSQVATNLPSGNDLLELEAKARSKGSGIEFDALIGRWKFYSVWKQGKSQKDVFFSSLLKTFDATLKLSKASDKDSLKFDVTNSIKFGVLSIKFLGSGELKGSQPILRFFFERIELNLDSTVLYQRFLKEPAELDQPFFALISIEQNNKWLAARGRGGGLAIWLKET